MSQWKPLGLADEYIFEVYANALQLFDDGLALLDLEDLLIVAEGNERYKVCAGLLEAIKQIKSELNGSSEFERY